MRRANRPLTSSNDVCIFCTSKLWARLPATPWPSVTYRRQFQSSTTAFRPPAAAAIAKEEDEEPQSQFQQQRQPTRPPPKPQPSAGTWGRPAFGGGTSQSAAGRWARSTFGSGSSLASKDSVQTSTEGRSPLSTEPQQAPSGGGGSLFNVSRDAVRPQSSNGVGQSAQDSQQWTPRFNGFPREAPRTLSNPERGRRSNTYTSRSLGNMSSISREPPPPSYQQRENLFRYNHQATRPPIRQTRSAMPSEDQKPGMDNAAYNVGYGGSMAASQFRMIAQRDRSAPPSTPSDHTSGQYQRASGPNRYGGTNDESTLGLENGWKHLRHTPAKRFRIEQEKREERSKLGGWTGFSKTIESFPETPGKSGGKQDDSLTTFNPMFDTRGRKGHELIPPVAASEQQRSGIVRQPEENLEFGHRWGRSKEGRRAEKFAEPDEYEELDNLAKTPNPRTDVRNRGRKSDLSRSKRVDDDDFDIEAFEIARAKRRARMRQDDALKKERELAAPKPIAIPDFISVVNLGILMGIRPEAFRGKLEDLGFSEATNDHILDSETAGLIAAEFNFEPVVADPTNADLVAQPPVEDQSSLLPRPPVVTIMGHVDHGKTTILDYLRKSSVAASEHGGITQHIGAFSVPMPSGKLITFLDTPGHAAFLDMRRRGANMTDIVILVVAGDDSVKPQTIEAIKHIKEANVATIVAINKIDKEDANAERVKQDLSREGIAVEDYGGEVQAIPVSGKTGQGMPDLEEAAVALSDMLDMRTDRSGFAEGWVIEASTKRAGRVATVLVRRGTLRPGNIIVAGMTWARVKGLKNEAGVSVSEAGPGTPVEVDGWKDQPVAGDEVLQAPSEARAKAAIDVRLEKQERGQLMTDILAINDARRVADEKRAAKLEAARKWKREHPDEWVRKIHDEGWQGIEKTSGVKEVAFIAKADVSGSVEAVVNSVAALGNAEVRANVLRSGVGPISAFDVEHAAAAEGHILNFNTTVDPNIARMAEMEGVEIFDHNIIYKLVDAVKAKLSDQLEPLVINKVTGEAEIGQVFDIKVKGKVTMAIAGCKVRNGVISRSSKVRVLRGKDIIFDGTLSSLKNIKKDVTEMRKGTECGMSFEDWQDFQVGDQVQCYDETSEKRYLD